MTDKPRFQVGQHIRDHVLPPGITVTAAAKRLGVGRPALSNLLNGNAALSEEMALRLERTFGADRDALLKLHRSQERPLRGKDEREVAVRGYMPSFLSIKARDIEQWADQVEARQFLSVLLRKLVHETGRDLTRVDFPGFDNSQRSGWDGVAEARRATAWIPAGLSFWEFGTDQGPRRKAESDYAKRLSLPLEDRVGCTFIFVTPRNWPGKGKWVQEKEASSDGWQAVRAYDASDLEQWLEDAIAAPLWFAEQCLGSPVEGAHTLDRYWRDWSQVSDPPMSRRIFEPNVKTSISAFGRWLNAPPDRPFVVASDSIGETLAFVTCLFEAAQEFKVEADSLRWEAKRDMAAVFESRETFQRLADSSQPFIPIAGNVEVEETLAPFWNLRHCIVHSPRNAVSVQPDVALEMLGLKDIHEALDDMGVSEGERERLERESGRSPTILRRRLSKLPVIRTPPWSTDAGHARQLIPMALVGAWRADRKADKEILATLADRPYEHIEQAIADLLALDDCPLWSIGNHRGIASKMDALYAVASRMTSKEVEDFFVLAELVLSESDPALELPQDQRWAAAIYDKLRDHSDAMREGVRETLVVLATHGASLFGERLATTPAASAGALIRRMLDPLTVDRLKSQDRDLPAYAEAAPETVLRLLEADLDQEQPAVLALLTPTPNLPFTHSPRVGLLWALECIAWNPRHLSRVCAVLAKLAGMPIRDNLSNKPIESLGGILRSWMPQTAASVEERIRVLAMLVSRFPDVMWGLCMGEIPRGPRHAMANYRPKWRADATGAGGVATNAEYDEFTREAWRLLVSWDHSPATLGDLVERLPNLNADDQATVWGLVNTWADSAHSDEDRATLRDRIRNCCLTRFGHRVRPEGVTLRAKEAVSRLVPADLINRHAWLFESGWVAAPWNEEVDDPLDWQAQEAKIRELRQEAMGEIWSARGLEGALALVKRGNAAEIVGRYVGACVGSIDATASVLRECVAEKHVVDQTKLDTFVRGVIGYSAGPSESDLLLNLGRELDCSAAERLLRCAPFHEHTWRILDRLPDEVGRGYWQNVTPYGWTFSSDECREIIDRLLEARRPRAAFASIKLQWASIDANQLTRLLTEVSRAFDEPTGHFPIDSFDLSNALEALDAAPEIKIEQLALLEFAFIDALADSERGVPNLERAVWESPSLFVQAVRQCYLRDDGTEDPGNQASGAAKHRAAYASHRLLDSIRRIPGTRDDGTVNQKKLVRWVTEARDLFEEVGRKAIGDGRIGALLSRTSEEDDEWPCAAVCEAMEVVRTDEIADGFVTGKRNTRGVVVGDPVPQDRALAEMYRRRSERRRTDFPFVGDVLLRLARTYDSEADMWERQATVDKRLGH